MKRVCLLSIVVFIFCAVNAQTEFSVPAPTMEQRFVFTRMVMYNTILGLIDNAKSNGVTPAELGKSIGEKFPWDEDATYEQLVNFSLTWLASNSDTVQIIEQTNEKVVITTPHIYPNLENQGVVYGSTVEDLITFFDAIMGAIADPLGLSCDITWGEEGLKMEIAKL